MDTKSLGIISVLGLITLFVIGYQWSKEDNPCRDKINYAGVGLNQNANLDSILALPTPGEIEIELSNWKNFDLNSDSVLIVAEYQLFGRQTFILATFKNDTVHYGAVMIPVNMNENKRYHAIIWANGLNQFSPSVSLAQRREIKELCKSLKDFFIIIPSFRGQALEVSGHYFCSDGFFGDAFDGATDDALRLYHASKNIYPQIVGPTSIYGVSRGGTVALLAGIRHPDVQITISQAAPTDFLGKQYYNRYGIQYKYQFLSQTTNHTEIRSKLLKSSPVHFIDQYTGKLFIVHGKYDQTVSIAHARAVLNKPSSNEKDSLITNSGHNSYHMSAIVNYIRKYQN